MRDTEDYELVDTNFNEFIRRGMEEMEWERKNRNEDAG